MLKTYRIIPLVFILFLFGFTFITVSPVLAVDTMEFFDLKDKVRDLEMRVDRLERGPSDKDPFTYSPNDNPRQSRDGKFHCTGYPEIRENPDEPKGVAYAKCKQKFDEAKR